MSLPVKEDFTIVKGTSWIATFVYGKVAKRGDAFAVLVPNDARGRYYVPISLAGYVVALTVRSWNSDTVELSLSTGDFTIDEPNGIIEFRVQTGTWTWDEGEYALEITSPSADIIQLARGNLTLMPSISV